MSKQQNIVNMFDNIANTYDRVNRVLSFGVDKNWRKKACRKTISLINKDNLNILDMACGTGDMIHFWIQASKKQNKTISSIIGIDPSQEMLKVAQKKFPNTQFKQNNATDFEEQNKDIISISYGLRNVVQRKIALKSFFDALSNNGLLVILEFTKLDNKTIISKIRNFYMKKILPFVGGIMSMNFKAYKYLPDSIDDFVTAEELEDELKLAGFSIEYTKGYSWNISTLIIAKKEI